MERLKFMEYINNHRQPGLTGLMRVMNDSLTLAQSIDSCISVLDELIITYNDCTDESPQIIARKKQEHPDKIQVIPYPYHVYGVNLTDEEYEYVKSLPDDSPYLLASYYNNALKYANYQYVVKIDADQIYFTEKLAKLRNDIVNGIPESFISRMIGDIIGSYFITRISNKWMWIKWHLSHNLFRFFLPLFKAPYYKYAISELRNGNANLSLSGINALCVKGKWYSPIGCKTGYGIWNPYNGEGDTLVFEATDNTYYVPRDLYTYKSSDGKHAYIERFVHEDKAELNIGMIWFHLKPMQSDTLPQLKESDRYKEACLVRLTDLMKMSYGQILNFGYSSDYSKRYYKFVHYFDRESIADNMRYLQDMTDIL